MRWTTGIGIALGGVGGAIAALLGAPKTDAPLPPISRAAPAPPRAAPAAAVAEAPSAAPAAAISAEPAAVVEPAAVTASTAPSAAASASASAPSAAVPSTVLAAPPLDVPTTREALLKAEMLCDQKKDFDECARAAQALETGTTGPVDLEQAKRFRRIALTHLVMQCESGSAHACFVLAAKYRAGTELANKPSSAEALEKRGAELCRLGRTAPECPPQP
jgi:hypothetical protein